MGSRGAAAKARVLLLLVAAVGLAPPVEASQSRAATLAEYRGRVGAAVAPLEELASFYDLGRRGERPDGYSHFQRELPRREAAALGRVRGLLPPRGRVEAGGGSFAEVDNRWLHESLDEYSREGDRWKRLLLLRGAAGRLRALGAQLGGAEAPPLDKDAERGRLNAILRDDPAFNRETRREEGALQRLLREFLERLAKFFRRSGRPVMPGASPGATWLSQVLVFALCLGVLAYVGWLLWRRRGRGATLKLKREPRVVLGERLEADATSAGLLDDAERLARAGDLRGAIRKAYVALLLELGDRGILRLSRHRTNRDYLNAVRRAAAPGLYSEMLPLTFDFELHWYGLRDASDADWESFRARCRKILNLS